MPTVRYVHPTLGPYTTIQAAHDAATDGDTLLIAPGTYEGGAGAVLTLSKPVHLKGDTTDPAAVVLQANSGPLNYNIANLAQTVWIEGVTLRTVTDGGVSIAQIRVSRGMAAGGWLKLNRTSLEGPGSGVYAAVYVTLASYVFRLRLERCFVQLPQLYNFTNAANALEVVASAMPVAPHPGASQQFPPGQPQILDWAADGTPGYGPAFGAWYAPQWQGAAYGIAGQILLPAGVDRTAADIRLYRQVAGRIAAAPWMLAKPDAAGSWAFAQLPTDEQFWVVTAPPAGYQPRIDGPYVPAAG